jgi:hypothetical protein
VSAHHDEVLAARDLERLRERQITSRLAVDRDRRAARSSDRDVSRGGREGMS